MRPTTLPGSCGAAPSRRSGRNCRGAGFVTCHAGSVTDTLRAQGIHQRFGDRLVLDGVDLEVPSARLLGLLGPNAAAKPPRSGVPFGLPRPTAGPFKGAARPATDNNGRSWATIPRNAGLYGELRVMTTPTRRPAS